MTAGIWAVLLLVIPAAAGIAWWRRRLEEERRLEGEAADDMTFGTQLLVSGFQLTFVVLVLLGVAYLLLLLLFS